MRTPLSAFLLLALAGALPAADESALWRYVHPQARLIAGGDFKKAANSVLFQQLKKEFNAAQVQTQGADILNMMERFLISMPELPGAQAPSPVIALEGAFDRARLKKTMPAGTGTERYKGVDLFVPPKSRNTDMLLAQVSDRVALIGDRAGLERVLTSHGDSLGALEQRARDLSVRNALWMVSDDALLQSDAAADAPPFMKDVTHIDLALSLDKGIDLSVLLGAKSPEAAKALAAMTESAKYLMGSPGGKAQPGTDLLKKLQVSVGANEVRLNFVMPAAEVTRMVAGMKSGLLDAGMAMMAGMTGGGTPSLGFPAGTRPAVRASAPPPVAAATPVPAVPQPPQKRTIRIVGAEDGDKEVTYVTGTKPPGTN